MLRVAAKLKLELCGQVTPLPALSLRSQILLPPDCAPLLEFGSQPFVASIGVGARSWRIETRPPSPLRLLRRHQLRESFHSLYWSEVIGSDRRAFDVPVVFRVCFNWTGEFGFWFLLFRVVIFSVGVHLVMLCECGGWNSWPGIGYPWEVEGSVAMLLVACMIGGIFLLEMSDCRRVYGFSCSFCVALVGGFGVLCLREFGTGE